jgi:type VI secretion system protein ImpH
MSRDLKRDLIGELQQDAPRFRFFQAVRLLSLAQQRTERLRRPKRLRFRTPATLSFPASEIHALKPRGTEGGAAERLEMEVSFLGLTGPSGVLPVPYTELLIERRQVFRDSGLHEFLDLFNHRALNLFFDAWRKYRFWVGYEAGERNGFTRNLLDLVGVGLDRLSSQLAGGDQQLPQLTFSYYAGLLAQKPISASNLTALVRGFFGVEAQLEQFVGKWVNVPEPEQAALGKCNCQLGIDTFAGERIWDRQTKLRLRIGPLRRTRFAAFLPGGAAAQALKELLHFCLGHSLAVDVVLVLHRDELPEPRLDAKQPIQLGFNSWARTRPASEDSDDVCYSLLR